MLRVFNFSPERINKRSPAFAPEASISFCFSTSDKNLTVGDSSSNPFSESLTLIQINL
jgi:hypothetical protein